MPESFSSGMGFGCIVARAWVPARVWTPSKPDQAKEEPWRGFEMIRFIAIIVCLAILPGWTDMRGAVRVEQASPGQPYDFVVHVRSIPDIKYNPLEREDRRRMALALVKQQCWLGRVVGEDKRITEIWGITSSPPDYIVLVSCARKPRQGRPA
jgi:hypothetical protein